MFDAIVLAGGGKSEPLAHRQGVSNKAFICIHGRPMLGYVIDALAASPSVKRIIVVGPRGELAGLHEEGYDFFPVPERGSMLENVTAGLQAVNGVAPCLVLTGDIPLVDGEAIERFLELCAPFDGDFYYPIISRESCRESFSQMKRTYVRLREGHFTGGNVVLLSPGWFFRSRSRLDLFVIYRKKPLKLLRLLPATFLFKFLLNALTVTDLERSLSGMLQGRAYAVPCDLVSICTDVDKPSDLDVVRLALDRG